MPVGGLGSASGAGSANAISLRRRRVREVDHADPGLVVPGDEEAALVRRDDVEVVPGAVLEVRLRTRMERAIRPQSRPRRRRRRSCGRHGARRLARAWLPPPGSWPKMAISPSALKTAVWPMPTPGNSTWCMNIGSSSEPPSAGSSVKIEIASPPAQAIFSASPRMTPVSWQACRSATGSAGSPEGTCLRYDAAAGFASGTSMMSTPRHSTGSPRGRGPPKTVFADGLL